VGRFLVGFWWDSSVSSCSLEILRFLDGDATMGYENLDNFEHNGPFLSQIVPVWCTIYGTVTVIRNSVSYISYDT